MGNAWLDKRQAYRQAELNASEQTMMQLCLDVSFLVLHEQFGFGATRLERFFAGFEDGVNKWHDALQQWEESGDDRVQLDRELGAILGDRLVEFKERYPYVKEAPKIGTGGEKPTALAKNREDRRRGKRGKKKKK